MNRTYARRKIKAEAQLLLNGNWVKVFLLLIFQILFEIIIVGLLPLRTPTIDQVANAGQDFKQIIMLFLPNGLNAKTVASFAVTGVLFLLVMSPFMIGVYRFFIDIARGKTVKLGTVFSVYASLKTVFSSIWLSVLVFLMSSFWSVIFMLVPILLMIASSFTESVPLLLFATILASVASVFTLLWNSRYIFASYIFAEGETGAFASLKECIELMRGRTKECLVLRFSYFFWDIMSSYVPLFKFPYFALSGTVYAKYLYYLRGTAAFSDETPHAGA